MPSVSPELTLPIWLIDRSHWHSWDGRTHQELLTVFKGKLRFRARGTTSSSNPHSYDKRSAHQRNAKVLSLSWPWANFITALFSWQMPTNLTPVKGSGFGNQSYSRGNIADWTGPGGNAGNAFLASSVIWLKYFLMLIPSVVSLILFHRWIADRTKRETSQGFGF